MELLLINHPLDCPVCDKGGECPLQNQAMSNGRTESRFVDVKRTYPKPLPISSEILLDRERCVLCARCTRFSQQVAGDPFIELFERGALEQVAIYEDEPFESYFSGNTTQICPVGALTSAQYRFRARPFDLRSEPSVCEHCASGCAQRTDYRRGKVTRRLAGEDPAVNEEWNCDKGRFAFRYATANAAADHAAGPARTASCSRPPGPRRGPPRPPGCWRPVTDGGVGVLPGGRLTVEDAYAYAKFARVALGTNDVDARARAHSAEELAFLGARVAGTGPGRGAVTYDDLDAPPRRCCSPASSRRRSRRSSSCGCAAAVRTAQAAGLRPRAVRHPRRGEAARPPCSPRCPAPRRSRCGRSPTARWGGPARRGAARSPGAVVLAGERLAEVPGAFSALRRARPRDRRPARLGAPPGRRARGRRGRRAAHPAARRPQRRRRRRPRRGRRSAGALDAARRRPGRDLTGILTAARDGELGRPAGRRRRPRRPARPGAGRGRAGRAPASSSASRCSRRAVTEWADVVLPVAAAPEKAGSYLDWEGRVRPFDATLHGTGQLPDGRVLQGLADEMDVDLRLPTPEAARAELAALGAVRRPGEGVGLDVAAGRRRRAGRPARARARLLAAAARRRHPAARRAGAGRHRPPAGGPDRRGRRRAARRRRRRPAHRQRRDRVGHPAGARRPRCPTGSSGCR